MESVEEFGRRARIYLLGSYRDANVSRGAKARTAKEFLLKVQDDLRGMGWDAYTQLHPQAKALVGDLPPLRMTRRLEEESDLNVYVAHPDGLDGGWIAEFVAMTHRYPAGASKRALLLVGDYNLSQVMDAKHQGVLADSPVYMVRCDTVEEVVLTVEFMAVYVSDHGRLPEPVRDGLRARDLLAARRSKNPN